MENATGENGTPLVQSAVSISGQDDVSVPNGSAVQLAAKRCQRVTVQCHPTHAGAMRVGGFDVSATRGTYLQPGDAAEFQVVNANEIYLWGLAADAVATITVET